MWGTPFSEKDLYKELEGDEEDEGEVFEFEVFPHFPILVQSFELPRGSWLWEGELITPFLDAEHQGLLLVTYLPIK